jgi:hypothetical protein
MLLLHNVATERYMLEVASSGLTFVQTSLKIDVAVPELKCQEDILNLRAVILRTLCKNEY